MLTWMQHHKKYLVVTIWISVIAFVGAGFVGWGAYDFNLNRSSSVAVVGEEKITFSEFNTRYNQIFNYYNQISNGNLNEENAKDLGLDTIALNSLIEDKLLLNFAKNLKLSASEDEILKELASISAFHNEKGEFNKEIYYEILKQNKLTPKGFEQNLADDIVIKKLSEIFNIKSNEKELQMLASSYFMQDSLSVNVLTYDKKDLKIDEEKLKKIWQENQSHYKTKKSYELSSFFIKANTDTINDSELEKFYNEGENKFKYKDFNGKILDFKEAKDSLLKDYALAKTKTLANEKFLELKNNKSDFQDKITIDESFVYYPLDLLNKTKNGNILRPIEWNKCDDKNNCETGYLIIRLDKNNPARIKSYEEAREDVLPLYFSEKSRENLEKEAREKLKNFTGINLGFLSRDGILDPQKINEKTLNEAEFSNFLMSVFNSEQNSSYVLLNDYKAILYKINKQKLQADSEKIKQYNTMLTQGLQDLKADTLKTELIGELKKQYPIKIYYKGN